MDEELRELFCTKIGLENARFKKKMLNQEQAHTRLTA